jgi:phosphatidylserine decarboxylase
MATVWHGVVNPPRSKSVREWTYHDASNPIFLKQGEEMGRFLLGSTVVMLWPSAPSKSLSFHPSWLAGKSVRLGEEMANHAQ